MNQGLKTASRVAVSGCSLGEGPKWAIQRMTATDQQDCQVGVSAECRHEE